MAEIAPFCTVAAAVTDVCIILRYVLFVCEAMVVAGIMHLVRERLRQQPRNILVRIQTNYVHTQHTTNTYS